MKLLFVSNAPRNENLGASGCDLATIAALRDLGHEVDEIWTQSKPRRIRHGNLHQLLELPRVYARAVDEKCREKEYDVVQVNQPHAYLAARMHRDMGRKGVFVNRSHGWEPNVREHFDEIAMVSSSKPIRQLASKLLWGLLRHHNSAVLRYSDGVVLCSQEDRDYVTSGGAADPRRVIAVAPGVADDFLAPAPARMTHDRLLRLLYVGQWTPVKAPALVARIASEILASSPQSSMTWVCEHEHQALAKALVAPAVRSRVTFLDWMPRAELRGVYDTHGVLLFPSYFEGFPLAFVEAMARGMCVLASRVGGMKETIQHGRNGFLFEPGQVDGYVQAALALLTDPEQAQVMSRSARETAVEFTWNRAAMRLVEFYERLIEMRQRSIAA